MKRLLFLSIACCAGLGLHAGALGSFAGLSGRALGAKEAAAIRGGDILITVNSDRTKMTVNRYTNDKELARLNPAPISSVTVDVHNRVADTTKAPFMPASGPSRGPSGETLTSRPSPFPEGTAAITGVKATSGRFGPNMITTNAVGKVEVFSNGKSVGTAADTGYAIHSNTNDFSASKSYGCLVVRQGDNAKIADMLRADASNAAKNGGKPVQLIHVGK